MWIFEKLKEGNFHAACFLLEMSYNCSCDEFLKIFGSNQKLSVVIVCISNGKTHIIWCGIWHRTEISNKPISKNTKTKSRSLTALESQIILPRVQHVCGNQYTLYIHIYIYIIYTMNRIYCMYNTCTICVFSEIQQLYKVVGSDYNIYIYIYIYNIYITYIYNIYI